MRLYAALVVALLTLLTVSSGAVVQPASAQSQHDVTSASPPRQDVILTIQLQPNGDARWNVTTEFRLADANDTAAFKRLAADFEKNQAETGFSMDVVQRIVTRAENQTGRTMTVTGVSRTSSIQNRTGRLTLAFTWTNFTQVRGGSLRLGDVFTLDSGTWLSSLSADQRLVIEAPPHYAVTNSNFAVTNSTISLHGPRTFEPGDLSVHYIRQRDTSPTPPGQWSGLNLPLVLLVATVVGMGGLGAYAWTRQREDPSDSLATASPPVAEPRTAPDDGDPETDAGATGDAKASGDADDSGDETGEQTDGPSTELLSDEERVERLLASNDGRMMQANIVKETGWSNAKVSQLLSAMDETGRINKLRIGRENLITFPDEDVSEFD